MLVLARRTGETIVIGDNVRITVMESKGKQITLGVTTPEDVAVKREAGTVNKTQFEELLQSVEEMDAIARKKKKPTRTFKFPAPKI